ncbi:MAG: winged helix-turn-helix domain-containing protein [Bacteroides sp.]|nr:winged helix-turn-helix domain-containing protein [Bacteroides sp.]
MIGVENLQYPRGVRVAVAADRNPPFHRVWRWGATVFGYVLIQSYAIFTILRTVQRGIAEVTDKVPDKSDLAIMRLLADSPRLTRIELAEKIGITESGVKKIITKMKAEGWIERKGSNKSGYWVVNYK